MPTADVRTITVPHLGRVEGHGGITVKLVGDTVADVNMEIHEGSRYYEALLVGKHFLEVQGIITRVCAICSADHTVAALQALENALGIPQSPRVFMLRGLMLRGAMLESHALHVFALALPDYLGYPSVMAMAADYPAEVAFALRLKQLGNRVQALIGGRAVHPVNTLVGGFGRLPRHRDLEALRAELLAALPAVLEAVDLVASIDVPGWARQPIVSVALRPYENGFRFRGSTICTSRGDEHPVADYRTAVREFTVEHSHAKHAALSTGEAYMVGSLPRLRLWSDLLDGLARDAFDRLFPNGVEDDVLLNNHAQVVEIVHCLERGAQLCDELLGQPELERELAEYDVCGGRGITAVEVPRGTLFHEYGLDDEGRVTDANIVTPTAQNLADVERHLRHTAESMLHAAVTAGVEEIERALEMVVRAYDPCISCSVHVTRAG